MVDRLPMSDRLAVLPQYLLPKQALTRLAGVAAGARGGALTTAVIRWFVGRYGVDMAEAAEPDVARYATFNDFFTRALKPGARPLADAAWLCPVDGAISQFGPLDGERSSRPRATPTPPPRWWAATRRWRQRFPGGHFATLYLSPRDYHRIHMPAAGRLRRMIHVPGELFSVNPTTARGVPGLFARNERVVCVFDGVDGSPGPFVLVLVGATIVGSMATAWHGVVNPPRPGTVRDWTPTTTAT
jgi:phosphatidylserine decarboxylase